MELTFIVDKSYLAFLILTTKGLKLDTYLKNKLWEKYKSSYKFLQSQAPLMSDTLSNLQKLLDECIESDNFKTNYKESLEYLDKIKSQWEKNRSKTISILEKILKVKLPKIIYTIYITHPKFHKGKYLGDYKISYTHDEEWPNYNIVYLVHEILHGILPSGNLSHAVIELITDNELRLRLSPDDPKNKQYFVYSKILIGHKNLHKLETKLLPKWKKYLESNDSIYEFLDKNLTFHQ